METGGVTTALDMWKNYLHNDVPAYRARAPPTLDAQCMVVPRL